MQCKNRIFLLLEDENSAEDQLLWNENHSHYLKCLVISMSFKEVTFAKCKAMLRMTTIIPAPIATSAKLKMYG